VVITPTGAPLEELAVALAALAGADAVSVRSTPGHHDTEGDTPARQRSAGITNIAAANRANARDSARTLQLIGLS
jgi:hypothetical protein